MIGYLRGTVLDVASSGSLLLDVQGVGYELSTALSDLPAVGADLELFVHTSVRADAIVLYGFASLDDRSFFEQLLNTPGVGPATALAALRTMTSDELAQAIHNEDQKQIAKIPGIGPKTASRIILELRGKIVGKKPVAEMTRATSVTTSVEEGLKALGYSAIEIREALQGVELSSDETAALREALKLMGRR